MFIENVLNKLGKNEFKKEEMVKYSSVVKAINDHRNELLVIKEKNREIDEKTKSVHSSVLELHKSIDSRNSQLNQLDSSIEELKSALLSMNKMVERVNETWENISKIEDFIIEKEKGSNKEPTKNDD